MQNERTGGGAHIPQATERDVCGIVMPISGSESYTAAHWADVLQILTEAAERAEFTAKLVSNSDDVGVIHNRIIQNLYSLPIVICDVSSRNPNAMFELGMRLAFDKPVVLVKDDATPYSFDTAPIEHLSYPRDLRYQAIVDFKIELAAKIRGTVTAASKANHPSFLKHFGEFKVAKLESQEVPLQDALLQELESIRRMIIRQENRATRERSSRDWYVASDGSIVGQKGLVTYLVPVSGKLGPARIDAFDTLKRLPGVVSVEPRTEQGLGNILSIKAQINAETKVLIDDVLQQSGLQIAGSRHDS